MPCFKPIKGFRSKFVNASGKRSLVFSASQAIDTSSVFSVEVACGQCVGCRLERSRQWAIRCVHEASLYQDNCFITLTYSKENLPKDGSLNLRHFQLFMKRLRKRFGSGIRFFHAGEYGSLYGRPHYHACLFNFDFDDKVLFREHNNTKLYRSASLEELWTYGYSSVGSVNFKSAAYVARYIMKKITGDLAHDHYLNIDDSTGELFTILPEYTTMSRRPGIGKGWLDKFSSDVYRNDEVVLNGRSMKPPKFYDSQFEIAFPDDFAVVKSKRVRAALSRSADNTSERLLVREKCKASQVKLLVRPLDSNINND